MLGARPMPTNGFSAGALNDRAQNPADNDGIVGVAEDGNEIGDQIEGHGEISQEQPEPNPNSARQSVVARQTAKEPKRIGQQSKCLAQQRAFGTNAKQDQDQDAPREQQAKRDPRQDAPN